MHCTLAFVTSSGGGGSFTLHKANQDDEPPSQLSCGLLASICHYSQLPKLKMGKIDLYILFIDESNNPNLFRNF